MKKFIGFVAATILTFTALLGASIALAQTPQPAAAGSEDQSLLGEVVVTAQYREEKLQETPIAITAITAEDIEERSFTDSYEIGYTVPNASFRPAQAAFGNTMTAYIRGVGQNDFDQAFEPGVGIYVDDVYQPFTLGTQMDLLDLERVEVLRGPQGTLFGRGSIGGVMRLVSKQPDGSNSGYVDLTTGSYDRIDLRAGYDFALSDNVFARVTGVSRQSEGYQDVVDFACRFQDDPAMIGALQIRDPSRGRNCIVGHQGGSSVVGIRGQLRLVASDNVDFNFAVDYQDDSSEAKADTLVDILYPVDAAGNTIPTSSYALWNTEYAQHVPTQAEPWGFGIPYDSRFITNDQFTTYATYDDQYSGLTFTPESGLEKISYSAKMNWRMTDRLSLTAIAAYSDMTGQISSDADASPMNLQVTGGQQDFDWTTGEVRLSGDLDRIDWTVGLFYYEGTAENRQAVSFPPILWGIFRNTVGLPPAVAAGIIQAPGNVSVNTENIADSESQAVFIHTVTDLTDRVSITLGARYSEDKKDVAFDNTFVVAPINIDEDHTDWRAGIDFKLSDDAMLYASAATGYRPSAYNPRPFTPAQATAVGGEEMTAYELGLKADLFDRKMRANIAVFYSDYNKRIVPIGGTECIPPLVAPGTPGAIQDSNGNFCLATTSLTSYQQLEGAEIQGAELELTWRPTAALMFNGTFGYTDWSSPDIDNCDFNQDGQPDPGVNCSDRPTYVPEYNWSGSIAYSFGGGGDNGSITPRVDAYGQSEICSSVVSELACAADYTLLNARIEWTDAEGLWTIALGGTNITDEEYYLNIFDLTPFGQNTVEGQPGRPAEWYLQFRRTF